MTKSEISESKTEVRPNANNEMEERALALESLLPFVIGHSSFVIP